jgi:hypothetical protein
MDYDEVMIVNPLDGNERRQVMLGRAKGRSLRGGGYGHLPVRVGGQVMLGEHGQLMEVHTDGTATPLRNVILGADRQLYAVESPMPAPRGVSTGGATLRRVGKVVRGRGGRLYESTAGGRLRGIAGELVAGHDGRLYELHGLAQKYVTDKEPIEALGQSEEDFGAEEMEGGADDYGDDYAAEDYEEDDFDTSEYDDENDQEEEDELGADQEFEVDDFDNQSDFDIQDLDQDVEFDVADEFATDLDHDELDGAGSELDGFVQVPHVVEPNEKPATGAMRPAGASPQKGNIFTPYF